jgi:hypothetical protein
MTVLRGKVWPDNEFPAETFAYHADRNSVHDFGTPLQSRRVVDDRVEPLKTDPETYRLRIARYELVEVIEVDCVGERPCG